MSTHAGLFIVFEGPEGSGKTTQIRLLGEALKARGRAVLCTREPGGTPIGEQIRQVLHDMRNRAMHPLTEALLYSAARAQHVKEVIGPALERGEIVLCDRFAASTLAYQGYGHGLDLSMLRTLAEWATGGLQPDLIIYLDLDVEIGLARKRRDQEAGRGEWNRMDEQTLAFHQAVRQGYLEMARQDPAHWLVVDATQPQEVIHRIVLDRLEAL
ncbi:MAG: dTMP kinase [Chloroflexi bacterium]|nr:dTMP kinase [Chloroflexota bacterium]